MWDLCWGFKHDLLLFVIFARILELNLYDRMLLDRSTIILCFAGAIWLLHNLLWSKSTQWFGSAMSRDMSLLLPARVQLCYINNWCARYKLFSLLDCHIVILFFFWGGGGSWLEYKSSLIDQMSYHFFKFTCMWRGKCMLELLIVIYLESFMFLPFHRRNEGFNSLFKFWGI
jgi:hypothetical protein